jgi:hypothetical protein
MGHQLKFHLMSFLQVEETSLANTDIETFAVE